MPRAAEPFGVVRDRAVYLPDAEALVVADLHLGQVAASPVDAPIETGPEILDRLVNLVDRYEPDEVVLAGDVLHAFGFVPQTARETLTSLRQQVETAGATLVHLEGNHDAQLAALIDHTPAAEHVMADGSVACHGHERPSTSAKQYVIGHDHPVIEIEGRRRPCYLYGRDDRDAADVLALPSFNPAVRGSAVNRWADGDPLSPLLSDVTRFRPIVWDADVGEPFVFPSLGALQPYL